MKRLAFILGYCSWLAVFFLGGLKAVDFFVLDRAPLVINPAFTDPHDLAVFHKDLYPYTGGHTQPNYELTNGLRTGDHGFFVDFDLDRPPAKKPGELRLILTGGSAAMGWGVARAENMIFHLLESLFNKQEPCGGGNSLRVINLAMGDSIAYQNFVALNRWGHALEPDAVLSFSGWNDVIVPYRGRDDAYRDYEISLGLNLLSRFESSPGWLKVLADFYPGLVKKTSFGFAMRAFAVNEFFEKAKGDYRKRFPPVSSDREVMDRITKPHYVNALKSIKRDFQGIPMIVAFQPYMLRENDEYFRKQMTELDPQMMEFAKNWRPDYKYGIEPFLASYKDFTEYAVRELKGYLNADWTFVDVNEFFRRELMGRVPPGDGIHMQDEVQQAVAQELAKSIFPVLCRPRRPPY